LAVTGSDFWFGAALNNRWVMRIIRDVSENELVLAFVRAEVFSPTYGPLFVKVMGSKQPVYDPDLSDPAANALRLKALGDIRGYKRNTYLFRGFPDDPAWKLVAVTVRELQEWLYANCEPWTKLSRGSRLVRDGAVNLEEVGTDANANILAVERDVRRGQTYPPLIAAAKDESSPHVLAEGHTRATAYVRALQPDDEAEVIVGYAPDIEGWAFN
jgi:hypothetical protein